MKRILLLLIFLALLCAAACGRGESDLAGHYRAEGGGEAALRPSFSLNQDGTFSYSPSMISSYMGVGRYTAERDRVTLVFSEGQEAAVFSVTDDGLLFEADASSENVLGDVEDGTVFVKSE
jgi:hypothetical protein